MKTSSPRREYAHQELITDYAGLAGYYCPYKEVILDHEGRQVLYIVGHAAINNSCCGISNWDYVLVPGYIIERHKGINNNGLPLSSVEPIQDAAVRQKLAGLILERENTDRISFW